MTRAHFVKKAQKDHPEGGIKKGESYYWWAFMVSGRGGPKHFSKTPPRRSQLTQSDFYSTLYDIEDDIAALPADDGLPDSVSEIAGRLNELADETEGKKENLPQGLQDGQPGEQLQERADACRSAADELEGLDLDYTPESEGGTDDEKADAEQEHWDSALSEVQGVSIDAN
jgi:hypothetical protein